MADRLTPSPPPRRSAPQATPLLGCTFRFTTSFRPVRTSSTPPIPNRTAPRLAARPVVTPAGAGTKDSPTGEHVSRAASTTPAKPVAAAGVAGAMDAIREVLLELAVLQCCRARYPSTLLCARERTYVCMRARVTDNEISASWCHDPHDHSALSYTKLLSGFSAHSSVHLTPYTQKRPACDKLQDVWIHTIFSALLRSSPARN